MRTSCIRTGRCLAAALFAAACVAHGQQDPRPWHFHRGIDALSWQRMDAVAVVRVAGPPHIPEDPNDSRRDWPVSVLGTYTGGPSPSRLRVRGSWGVPAGWLEHPGTYLVIAAMPIGGKDAPLFDDQDMARLDAAPDGQARVYWALPFRGTPPRSGGTREEFFGRAVLAALEGDAQVYKEGLEEFLLGLGNDRWGFRYGGGLVGLQRSGGRKEPTPWSPGEFTEGLIAWAARQGPRERLFAGMALRKLGVAGARAYESRSVLEFAATDADPPALYSATFILGESAPQSEAEARLAPAQPPSVEEWLSTLLQLRKPKAQEMLLECRVGGEIGLDDLRRLSKLLDSPLPRVRWLVCEYFWGRIIATSVPEEEAERQRPMEISEERSRLHGPPDYPRLDEHVAYWRAYYR